MYGLVEYGEEGGGEGCQVSEEFGAANRDGRS